MSGKSTEEFVSHLLAGASDVSGIWGHQSRFAGGGAAMMHAGGGGAYVPLDAQMGPAIFDAATVEVLNRHGWYYRSDPASKAALGLPTYEQASYSSATLIRSDYDLDLLAETRSDLAALGRFALSVDHATFYLCAAFDATDGPDIWKPRARKFRISRAPRSWFSRLAASSFERWCHVRDFLVHPWTPSEPVRPLCRLAFHSLSRLTPADTHLRLLFEHDTAAAFNQLARHVDIVADQLKLASELSDVMDGDNAGEEAASRAVTNSDRLDALQNALLDKAGGRLSLTEGAAKLGISRQGLHKKIKLGSALGLMMGEQLVLPAAQFMTVDGRDQLVPGLKPVLDLFLNKGSGAWSAFQFLGDIDPLLEAVPFDRLKAGDAKKVLAAARAFLGVDEG